MSANSKKFKVSVDIGYGDVKVFSPEIGMVKFPNAIAPEGVSMYKLAKTALQAYEFEGDSYLIGEEAKNAKPLNTRQFTYLSEFSPLIIYKICKLIGATPDDEIQIVAGLSIKDWDKKEEIIERITKNVFVNSEYYKNIKVKLIPQGVGIYECYKYHNKIEEDFFAVADIGYNTVDLFIFKDGEPINNAFYADTNGIHMIVNDVLNHVTQVYGNGNAIINEHDAVEVLLKKCIRLHNKDIPLENEINKFVKRYIRGRVNDIHNFKPELLAKVKGVIIGGGGMAILKNSGHKLFDHEVEPGVQLAFANVIGYFVSAFKNDYTKYLNEQKKLEKPEDTSNDFTE